MITKIFTNEFWKAVFSRRRPSPDDCIKPPESKYMSQEQPPISIIQSAETRQSEPEERHRAMGDERGSEERKPVGEMELPQLAESGDVQEKKSGEPSDQNAADRSGKELTMIREDRKDERLIIRSELNLEQNSIFTVSTYREKSREVTAREVAPNGDVIERKAIIGRTADGIETGVLTTYHFKVYLALIDLWEKAGKPVQEPIHFTSLRIMKCLGMSDSGEEYRHFKRWLRNLRQIPITFINSFRAPGATEHTDLADVTVLNHLHIYERRNIGREGKTRGYGEFRFDDHILKNLIGNYTHPLRLDVIRSFTRHRDLSILLYTYIDRNLAFRQKYEIGLQKLFNHLDLSQRHVKYPSDRKRVIDPVLKELQGKPLSTGTLSYCHIIRTEDGKDYKLVCHKKTLYKGLQDRGAQPQLDAPQPEPDTEKPGSQIIASLVRKGLTQKQAEKLLSEKGKTVAKAQLEYLPFRLEEYKAQGRGINGAAILHESIKDDWQPPAGYFQAEKEKAKEMKRQVLRAECVERVRKAKAEAEEWAARPPEDRIAGKLNFWIGHKERFSHHQPTQGEIETKKKELVSELRTKEEYEQQLIDEIERDIRNKEQAI